MKAGVADAENTPYNDFGFNMYNSKLPRCSELNITTSQVYVRTLLNQASTSSATSSLMDDSVKSEKVYLR